MRSSVVAAVAVAALAGAGAGAAVTAYDGPDGRHPMMSGSGQAGQLGGAGHMGGTFPMGGAFHVSVASEQEFLVEMVAHHEEAIRAARELARSDRAEMRAFGKRIVAAQSEQVADMERWLDDWYAEDDRDAYYVPMMRDLSALSGDRLDRAFLADMVRHHMAAVMMSQHLLVSGLVEHRQVASLAREIRDDQRAEILQMRTWLAAWT